MKTKSNSIRLLFAAMAAAVLGILITSCYYMPGQGGGTARVAIGIAPGAKGLKGIPANLSSVALVVTAPGMAPITATASTTANSITVSVPAGPARTFTLLLNTPSATLEGVATVDLQAGQSTSVNVTPTLGATQLVIPDYNNSQVVQISDMTGTGWTVLNANSIGAVGATMFPYAVDFDNLGRIYIADGTGVPAGLIRVNDITSTTYTSIDATSGINSVAIDRTNGIIYYGTGSSTILARSLSTLAILPSLSVTGLTAGPQSIAVDSQGMLYLAIPGTFVAGPVPGTVVKINPSSPATPVAVSSFAFDSPWGIMVKGPYVYVSDNNNLGTKTPQIVRLDTNLNLVDTFPGPSSIPFLGPETFIAVLNRKFAVIDEDNSMANRVASFDDMTGTNWTTYGTFGYSGTVGGFRFYRGC